MRPANVVTFNKSGEIYIGKKATELLEISDCSLMKILTDEDIIIRLFKTHLHDDEYADHDICLYSKSGGVRGSCKKFTSKLQFGDANTISLEFISKRFDEGVEMRIKKPLPITVPANSQGEADKSQLNTAAPEQEEKAEATEVLPVKDRQADICREIVKRNGYQSYPEESIGTVSKPAEKQLDMSGSPASPLKTRPLPGGLPEWLLGPLSRGEQVRIVAFRTEGKEKGWAFGAFIDPAYGKERPMAVAIFDSSVDPILPTSVLVGAIEPCVPTLKPAAECLSVAEKLCIDLSLLQIKAINSGGVPPEGHGLPDEMFE